MKLDFGNGWIIAIGAAAEITGLISPQVQLINPHTILLPCHRANIMATEAMAGIEEVTPAYRLARAGIMGLSGESRMDTIELLAILGINPMQFLDHQLQFIHQSLTLHGVINASEQGTGKTRALLAAFVANIGLRGLVICPKSLVSEWANENERIGTGITMIPLSDGKVIDRKHLIPRKQDVHRQTIVTVNYDVIKNMKPNLLRFAPDTIICDESWRLKNPKAKATSVALALADQAKKVWMSSGTPIGNDIGDLWTQLRMVCPEAVTNKYDDFMRAFAQVIEIESKRTGYKAPKVVGSKNIPALITAIAPYWFRATKSTCLRLPLQQREDVLLTLPKITRDLFRDVDQRGEIALGNALSLTGDKTSLIRLDQIASGLRPVFNEQTLKFDIEFLPDPKIEWLAQIAEEILSGEPSMRVIVWGKFQKALEHITDTLQAILGQKRVALIYKDVPLKLIEEYKTSFNSRSASGVQVIVANFRKMAYGHNLQACDWNIYHNHTWSYIERDQSECRSHRLGRTDGVKYTNLIARQTKDEAIIATVNKKENFARQIAIETITDFD